MLCFLFKTLWLQSVSREIAILDSDYEKSIIDDNFIDNISCTKILLIYDKDFKFSTV